MPVLSDVKALIIDMDGVLWHGERPQPGLAEFFACVRQLSLPFVLATNNASITPRQYVDKLAGMGVDIAEHEILTSGMATASYLAEHHSPASTRIFVIGGEGARLPLQNQGFTLTDQDDISADLVVCGLDKQLSWDKLVTAALNIQAGAVLIGCNGDVTLPTERGFLPGNGATLAALTAATGVKPLIVGKPEPIMYRQALKLLATQPEHTIAIGDRLDTDILGAVRTGIRSLLVLSGISRQSDIEMLDYAPTWIMNDIRDITQALLDR